MSEVQILQSVQQFMARQHGHFIDGKLVAAEHLDKVDIVNPSTEQVVAQISIGSQQDVESAVKSAEHAFQNAWAETTPYERGVKLNKLADLIEQHGEELAQLESLSTGKLINISRHLEVAQSVIFLRYFAGWATKINGQTMQPSIPSMQGEKYTAFTLRQPIGVVAGIVPWNFSLMIGVWKIGSALTTGCTIVLKPSEFASLSLLRLAELAIKAGIPAGVINVVTGKGDTGQYLIESPLVKKVSFTGSVPTGIAIGKLAMSSDLTRVSLELGGKNAIAVLADANIDEILPTLLQATFVHQGQVCASPERFFVHHTKHNELVEKLSKALSSLKIGSAMDEGSMFGPLSNQPHFHKVKHYLDMAKANNQIIAGGEALDRSGYFVQPTLISFKNTNDPLFSEETFGPVVGVMPFETDEELIQLMNQSRFGLTASIWTNDLSKALRLIPKIEAGTLWVNMHTFLDPSVPFGGVKASGIGREFSDAFIEDYTELKSVMIRY
ncbi:MULTISPECIES: NAD-dependent phenylacetaldehyde dehydrogenase [Acinetobacter calcoaceticus/baumannii complex]|uniref:NAD-dependent phenylacetaldehyde dehydrogenase n=1 Tax=Acinetobacter calcoaceticus/baumannii complex TaxID=909768 RepID=UPI00044BB41B|nr:MULTISPECIES: NAD-dependent phenylacetaldehyde dehydrogenase [Acinetobacter calcoaceticus/baumannii complex]AJB48168.1 aldehyde dehydrogenase [Acinetobacter nosocomialis]EXE79175.1 aldehyde dehydrogenase family protein [Acinetobacter sp. 1566109]MBJ9960741.1 NAD-dependent phenylacetaldehyde dehydrogenase [Acinetobacter nosocomialis]MBR7741630.1 NAD-dependent phenylacetaldehyde dehydrogenase [Acinetobacter nosocomialis]MDO7217124.1 NAD-dependent phenylacetaldehyde dehydrogenase [Acinetobacte